MAALEVSSRKRERLSETDDACPETQTLAAAAQPNKPAAASSGSSSDGCRSSSAVNLLGTASSSVALERQLIHRLALSEHITYSELTKFVDGMPTRTGPLALGPIAEGAPTFESRVLSVPYPNGS